MISRDEVLKLAKLHGLRPWQEEKRYAFTLMLNALYNEPLTFKGGTYLWLFHGLRRFSEDLDFTENTSLKENLSREVSDNLSLLGINNELKIIKNNDITLSFRIMLEGPLYTDIINRVPVYVEISRREKTVKNRIALNFNFPEYNLPVRILSGMNLDEVSAEKVRAIYTRKKPRDIYDLYYLISAKNVNFDTDLINKKLEFYDITFKQNDFMKELRKEEKFFNKELRTIVMGEIPDIAHIMQVVSSWINVSSSIM